MKIPLVLNLLLICATAAVADDLPRVDLHVHIHDEQHPGNNMTPADAAALSRKMGVRFGILAEGGCAGDIHDDATVSAFAAGGAGLPVWLGLQVYGFDWNRCLSKESLSKLDYIAADALVFPDRDGRTVLLWLPGVKFDDAGDFMERYVALHVRVLAERIQIWANPTFLPDSLQSRYDELWTPERMQRVIGAAVKNHVAIEINSKYHIPSPAFIRKAKAAGAKFSFGSNRHVQGIGDIEWSLKAARECGLTAADMWLPARALERHPD